MPLKAIKEEESHYVDIPKYYSFNSIEERELYLTNNYNKIVDEIDEMIKEFTALKAKKEESNKKENA